MDKKNGEKKEKTSDKNEARLATGIHQHNVRGPAHYAPIGISKGSLLIPRLPLPAGRGVAEIFDSKGGEGPFLKRWASQIWSYFQRSLSAHRQNTQNSVCLSLRCPNLQDSHAIPIPKASPHRKNFMLRLLTCSSLMLHPSASQHFGPTRKDRKKNPKTIGM